MDHAAVAHVFRRLAIEAGRVILDHYDGPAPEARAKADASPVTEADLAADRLIREGLRAAFPQVPAVTEEDADSHSVDARMFFLVDPLDGTRDFLRRGGDFTVNIALIEGGRATRGVVHAPAAGRLFYTTAEGAPFEERGPFDLDAPGARIPLRVRRPDPAALVVVASKSHRNPATDAYIARYPVAEVRAAGSSLKFCLLAAGEADFYPRLGRTMEWDTAAGDAILAAAGGAVLRLDDHAPLAYGKPGFENPFFVATAPGVPLVRERAA
jgi:3'(2'), 5'-bisphosphate nucleotidase